MAKKKSRRHRVPRERAPQAQTPTEPSAPVQSTVTALSAAAIAPKAAPLRPGIQPSHNLSLELRMIALLGGGAIILLAILSMFQPTTHVANWLHL